MLLRVYNVNKPRDRFGVIVGLYISLQSQNALSNITASDIIDLVDNVTEGEEEVESPLPSEAIEDTAAVLYLSMLAILLILSIT